MRQVGSSNWLDLIQPTLLGVALLQVSSLHHTRQYQFRLTIGGPLSEPYETLAQLPSEPVAVNVQHTGSDTVVLRVEAPVEDGGANITHCLVKSAEGVTLLIQNVTLPNQQTMHADQMTVRGLFRATRYQLQISACNRIGCGDAVTVA